MDSQEQNQENLVKELKVSEFLLNDGFFSKKTIPTDIVEFLGQGRGIGLYWMFQFSSIDFNNSFLEPFTLATGMHDYCFTFAVSPLNKLLDIGLISGNFNNSLKKSNIDLLALNGRCADLSIIYIDKDERKIKHL